MATLPASRHCLAQLGAPQGVDRTDLGGMHLAESGGPKKSAMGIAKGYTMKNAKFWIVLLGSITLASSACNDAPALTSSAPDATSNTNTNTIPVNSLDGAQQRGATSNAEATRLEVDLATAAALPSGPVEADEVGGDNYGDEVIGYRAGSGPDAAEGAGAGSGGGGAPSFRMLDPIDGPTGNVLENPFASADAPSTFGIDVDTASYTFSRASVEAGALPEQDLVHVEDFLNYFDFHYAPPAGDDALSVYTELGDCPWNTAHELLLVGVKGRVLDFSDSPPAHLVFLVDVSGSMAEELSLIQAGLRSLSRSLRKEDLLSIVTYAGNARVVLEAAQGTDSERILAAIDGLSAGGSTAGADGVQMAYDIAESHFVEGGTNRVLLSTDGDFNVGLSSTEDLARFIAEKRASNVYLSVFGFGMSSSGYPTAETLADNGNGIFVYIDSALEMKRALGHALSGTLLTVATDVKLQVAFNPEEVKGYRLIGYENRLLSEELFVEDLVDAGDLGAGLTSTALFEIVPADAEEALPEALPGTIPEPVSTLPGAGGAGSVEDDTSSVAGDSTLDQGFAEVRIRYVPAGETTVAQKNLLVEADERRPVPTIKFLFAAGMSDFAMRLRGSQYLAGYDPDRLVQELETALPFDEEGAVEEAIDFVTRAHEL